MELAFALGKVPGTWGTSIFPQYRSLSSCQRNHAFFSLKEFNLASHYSKSRRWGRSFDVQSRLDSDGNENRQSRAKAPITRRQAIQILNGVLGVGTLALLVKMKEQFRLISPQAILASLGLGSIPSRSGLAPALAEDVQSADQLQKSLEYIDKIDKRNIPCPDFPRADWINSRPLSFRRELQGKVVLLDFFTYCCINCQHVLPKLRELEIKYGEDGSGGVVVVGVHSAKFTAERETANIAAAVERYEVKHPVINDERMELWNGIGVSSWPTLALIGPKGNLLALWSGEGQEKDIDNVIAAALQYYSEAMDFRPLPEAPKRYSGLHRTSESELRYPGKITISEDGKKMYVADSGNDRILEVDSTSKNVIRTFGSGETGYVDSTDPAKASFHSPQGLAVYDGVLYVADTEAHAVRTIDLDKGSVGTIGGNGQQGSDYVGGLVGKSQALSSPWDVEVADGILYVAMAGTHQIWSLELPKRGQPRVYTSKWQVFSGSGRELEKNSVVGRTAAWAQPSHLSFGSNGELYVADSESSSVRAISLASTSHPTRTLAGGDGLLAENLFAFGDREGRGASAKFQHPLAVCYDSQNGLVYVADSYNHRIKVVDSSGSAKVLCGSGSPGLKDGKGKEAMFWEPAGLAITEDGKKLYVADTNNFSIRVIDTETKKVSTLDIKSSPSTAAGNGTAKPLILNRRRAVMVPCKTASVESTVKFEIELPNKSHFTPGTISRYQVNLPPSGNPESKLAKLSDGIIAQGRNSGSFQIDLSKASTNIEAGDVVEVETVTYYCTEEDDVCRTEASVFSIPISASDGKQQSISHTIVPRNAATPKQ